MKVEPIAPVLLHPCPKNPRGEITPDSVAELRASIECDGQKQPCLVRPRAGHPGEYEIVLGHRRAKVAELLGLDALCVVEDLTDAQVEALVIAEHESWKAQDPFRQAEVVASLLDRPGWNVKAVADHLSKPIRWVAARANLKNLDESVRALVAKNKAGAGDWPVSWLEEVAKLDPASQHELAKELSNSHWRIDSKDRLDRLLAEKLHVLGKAPWKLDDATLLPRAGPCETCPKTSLRSPGLFDDELEEADVRKAVCRDGTCWNAKLGAHVLLQVEKAKVENPKTVLLKRHVHSAREILPGLEEHVEKAEVEWRFDKAKKGEKGAVPAIVVVGDDAGRKEWVLPRKESDYGRPRKEKKPAAERSTKEKLEDSRERISRRRMAHVVDAVRTAIDEEKVAVPDAEKLRSLVAVYGVPHPEKAWIGSGYVAERKKLWKAVADDESAWASELWRRLLENLVGCLRRFNPTILEKEHEEATWLAGVLGLDIAELEAAARKEIPDPRWWAAAETKTSETTAKKKKRGKKVASKKRTKARA